MLQNDFMKKLQMVDLQTQYEFIKDQVDSSVLEIFKRGAFINGPSVKEFQTELEEYLKVKHVIPCANGNRCSSNCFNEFRFETR